MSTDKFQGPSIDFSQVHGSPSAVLAAVAMMNKSRPGQPLNEFVAQNNAMAAMEGLSIPGLQISGTDSVSRAIGGNSLDKGGLSV